MTASRKRSIILVLVAVLAAVAVFAVINRDTIADLILKGGDTSLTGEPARSSPQARLTIDFLVALRASDMATIARVSTPEQSSRIQQEAKQPTPEFQENKKMILADLPADATDLRSTIKSVQIHKNQGVVTFETKRNSWFVTLERANGEWKVAGF